MRGLTRSSESDPSVRVCRSPANSPPFLDRLRHGRDAAFAVVALNLGIDMLTHLDGGHERAESLLDVGVSYAPLASLLLLPSEREATDA